jgi:hypothetical protein
VTGILSLISLPPEAGHHQHSRQHDDGRQQDDHGFNSSCCAVFISTCTYKMTAPPHQGGV